MSRLHRFYIPTQHNKYGPIELKHDLWLQLEEVIWQWRKVLRYQVGQEVVLFDGVEHERLYKIIELTEREAHLQLVTDFPRKTPARELYLLWSLLKKDKNDWVLQKCTELGVSHFIPLLADRSEKTGFNVERATKIVIEAAEQCGRSDIPAVREPLHVQTAVDELKEKIGLLVAEQDPESGIKNQTKFDNHDPGFMLHGSQNPIGVLIGPEGGWTDTEKQYFKDNDLDHLNLHDFTLRAETACVAAASKLLQ